MTLPLHRPHRTTERSAPPRPRPGLGTRVFAVQRTGAILVGLFLLVFGLLGFAERVDPFSTDGEEILGLSSNGLLSVISVGMAVVLLGAALRGPRVASTVMIVAGALFLLSALVNLAVLRTELNLLAFEIENVVFSVVVGLLLLVLGAYGRVSGHLPADSPYAHPVPPADDDDELPRTPEELAAEEAMREAERAAAEHHATDDQRRRVAAMTGVRSRADRREVWLRFDR
jgi:hypothetical protein